MSEEAQFVGQEVPINKEGFFTTENGLLSLADSLRETAKNMGETDRQTFKWAASNTERVLTAWQEARQRAKKETTASRGMPGIEKYWGKREVNYRTGEGRTIMPTSIILAESSTLNPEWNHRLTGEGLEQLLNILGVQLSAEEAIRKWESAEVEEVSEKLLAQSFTIPLVGEGVEAGGVNLCLRKQFSRDSQCEKTVYLHFSPEAAAKVLNWNQEAIPTESTEQKSQPPKVELQEEFVI